MESKLVNELDLEGFRRDSLSPEALLGAIEQHVHVLFRVAVGVGKSHAIDRLLAHKPLFERFGLVIYLAPTWRILREREAVRSGHCEHAAFRVIEPRPKDRCGSLDAEWSDLERRGCSQLAKERLCKSCVHRQGDAPTCGWPDQWRALRELGLLFMPEQHLLANRALVPMLLHRTGRHGALVIVDEGQVFNESLREQVSKAHLRHLQDVLLELEKSGRPIDGAESFLDRLLRARSAHALSKALDQYLKTATRIAARAPRIQRAGVDRFGRSFRDVSRFLPLLVRAEHPGLWIEGDAIHFVARPFLGCHVAVFSAHLDRPFLDERLASGTVASPFEHHRFIHTGSRVFNLKSRLGVDQYFPKNSAAILATFAAAIVRNIEAGRTTLLISRKKTKWLCAAGIEKQLRRMGCAAEVRWQDDAQLPERPDPRVIPLIHYGLVGVNDYAEYDAAYCLNGYYLSAETLRKRLEEVDPSYLDIRLEIESGPSRVRRAVARKATPHSKQLEAQANQFLRRLEIDPVIQAIGRVRFATRPREVVMFQMADLSHEVPQCESVATLELLRQRMGLGRPQARRASAQAAELVRLRSEGLSVLEAAERVGVSVRTVMRRCSEASERASAPRDSYSLERDFGTSEGSLSSERGAES